MQIRPWCARAPCVLVPLACSRPWLMPFPPFPRAPKLESTLTPHWCVITPGTSIGMCVPHTFVSPRDSHSHTPDGEQYKSAPGVLAPLACSRPWRARARGLSRPPSPPGIKMGKYFDTTLVCHYPRTIVDYVSTLTSVSVRTRPWRLGALCLSRLQSCPAQFRKLSCISTRMWFPKHIHQRLPTHRSVPTNVYALHKQVHPHTHTCVCPQKCVSPLACVSSPTFVSSHTFAFQQTHMCVLSQQCVPHTCVCQRRTNMAAHTRVSPQTCVSPLTCVSLPKCVSSHTCPPHTCVSLHKGVCANTHVCAHTYLIPHTHVSPTQSCVSHHTKTFVSQHTCVPPNTCVLLQTWVSPTRKTNTFNTRTKHVCPSTMVCPHTHVCTNPAQTCDSAQTCVSPQACACVSSHKLVTPHTCVSLHKGVSPHLCVCSHTRASAHTCEAHTSMCVSLSLSLSPSPQTHVFTHTRVSQKTHVRSNKHGRPQQTH